MAPMQWQLERFGDTATLYVSGALDRDGLTTLLSVCAALPPYVRTLRLDLQALGTMSAEALSVVRSLLHHWRDTRHGEFRLSTSYLVATCSSTPAPSSGRRWEAPPAPSAAMTAAYL